MNLKKRPRLNPTNPDEKPRITCYSNIIRDLDTLESTQLFTPERFKEIKDYVSEDKFGPVELKNGKHVPDWICHYDTGLMWGKWIAENGRGYYIERVLEKFLTAEEIYKINNSASQLSRPKGLWLVRHRNSNYLEPNDLNTFGRLTTTCP